MNKKYRIGLVIEGDGKGGVRAIRANDDALGKLEKQSRQTARETQTLGTGFKNVATRAGAVSLAVGGITAVVGSFATVLRTEAIHELNVLSDAFDVSVESLSSWTFAAESLGLSSEKVGDIFKDTADKIGDFAATGGGEAANIFDSLGLSIDRIKDLEPDQQLLAIAEGLDQVSTNGEKIFFLESLADEASRLLPLLENGAEGLKELQREADLLGITLDNVDAETVEVAADSFRILGKATEGFANQLTIQLASAFDGLGDSFLDFLEQYGGMEGVTERVVNTAVRGVGFILNEITKLNIILKTVELGWLSIADIAISSLAESAEGVAGLINLALEPLTTILGEIAEGWGIIFTAVGAFLGETGEGLRDIGEGLDRFANQARGFTVDAEDIRSAEQSIKDEAQETAEELENLRASAPGDDFVNDFKAAQVAVREQAAETVELAEANEEAQKQLAETNEATKEQAAEAETYATAWEKSIDRVDEAFADGWLDLIQGNASSVFDSVLGGFQSLLAEMAHAAITRPILLNVQAGITSLLGGSGGGLGGLLGGGGGLGGGLGGLLSGASGIGSLISGGIGGSILGIGNSLAGFGSSIGLGSTLGAFGSGIGSTGAILGTQGIVGGLGTSLTNIGSLFGSGSIIGGLGAALPIVGLAAGAASLINGVTGGRLFGTSYSTDDYGVEVEYQNGEFSGRNFEDQSRRRSLFRGTRRRTNYTDIDPEINAGFNSYFDGIEELIRTGAAELGIEEVTQTNEPLLPGGLFEGFARGEYFNIPPTYTESIDEYLNNFQVSERLSLEDLSEEEAQARIQEWTDSVATDLIDGVFGDVLDGLAIGGESLADTLTRVLVQMELVDAGFQSIDLSLSQLAETSGLSELEFSNEVVEAAGGTERLGALLQGYQAAFFSEEELLSRTLEGLADEVRTTLDSLGLEYGDDFRGAFESASANGLAAAELVEWLEAGNLVGQFEEIGEALAELQESEVSSVLQGFIDNANIIQADDTSDENPISDPIVEEVASLNEDLNTQLTDSNDHLVSIDNRLVEVRDSIDTNLTGFRNEINTTFQRIDSAIASVTATTRETARQVATVSNDLVSTTESLARFTVGQSPPIIPQHDIELL